MKESSYHSAKMAAYCREVHQLEDKFDGLELNHISRRLNEAADALAKVVSDREPVPIGVFTSDQHRPSVLYEESKQAGGRPLALSSGASQPSAPSDPKVMELDEDPATKPDPLVDGRRLTSTASSVRRCRRTRQKLSGSCVMPSPSSSLRANSTSKATPGSCNAASAPNRGSSC